MLMKGNEGYHPANWESGVLKLSIIRKALKRCQFGTVLHSHLSSNPLGPLKFMSTTPTNHVDGMI